MKLRNDKRAPGRNPARSSSDDPDSDGISDEQEILAGTDPRDPGSEGLRFVTAHLLPKQ